MAISLSIFHRFAKFFYCSNAKSAKFPTKAMIGYLLRVGQRISNICTSRLHLWSDLRPTGHHRHCNWPVEKASSGKLQIVNTSNIFCEQS